MKKSAKITLGLSALAVAGVVAFAVPAIAAPSSQPAAAPTSAPAPAQTAKADAPSDAEKPLGPGECTSTASISTPYHEEGEPVKLSGELVDMGATDVAAGEVGLNADGLIQTYTVAENDTLIGIGERLCVDYVTVAVYNHAWSPNPTIQPGQTLDLRPDPTVVWTR